MWQYILLALSRFRHLPDIGSSAAFWASIATMLSASGAWFTFVAASISNRQHTYEGIRNLLEGMIAELELVRDWASGHKGDQGYLRGKSQERWIAEQRDWFNPSRQIFTVETPTLKAITRSPYTGRVGSLISPVITLNHALHRLFESHSDYRALAHSEPELYRSVFRKLASHNWACPLSADFTEEEREYMKLIFGANLRMHVGLIGGADSPEEHCLYRAFRTAEQAIDSFKKQLRQEPLPWPYWILHITAGLLALNGIWQVLRWVQVL